MAIIKTRKHSRQNKNSNINSKDVSMKKTMKYKDNGMKEKKTMKKSIVMRGGQKIGKKKAWRTFKSAVTSKRKQASAYLQNIFKKNPKLASQMIPNNSAVASTRLLNQAQGHLESHSPHTYVNMMRTELESTIPRQQFTGYAVPEAEDPVYHNVGNSSTSRHHIYDTSRFTPSATNLVVPDATEPVSQNVGRLSYDTRRFTPSTTNPAVQNIYDRLHARLQSPSIPIPATYVNAIGYINDTVPQVVNIDKPINVNPLTYNPLSQLVPVGKVPIYMNTGDFPSSSYEDITNINQPSDKWLQNNPTIPMLSSIANPIAKYLKERREAGNPISFKHPNTVTTTPNTVTTTRKTANNKKATPGRARTPLYMNLPNLFIAKAAPNTRKRPKKKDTPGISRQPTYVNLPLTKQNNPFESAATEATATARYY